MVASDGREPIIRVWGGAKVQSRERGSGQGEKPPETENRTETANSPDSPRSNDTVTLLAPPTRRSTLGDRAFPVAAARAWNALPARVGSAPSLGIFRRHLKSYMFYVAFPERSN